VTQYKAWCRDHGFNGALNKSWQERRQERKIADQSFEVEMADRELMDHIRELGLDSVEKYTAWCKKHGLSTGSHKSNSQRKKERELASRLQSDAVLASMKDYTRRPEETIRAIYQGKLTERDLNRPHLKKIQIAFDDLGRDRKARQALLQLLLHVAKRDDFFDIKPAIVRLGPLQGNTFIEALGVLASWHKRWLCDPLEWRPDTHNARKQFGSLARHLLAKYNVPVFMDTAWFLEPGPESQKQQEWFVHVGTGGNIRKAEIPLTLTKKMAHLFLESPDDYTVYEAFRRGQILGLGGESPLVRAVNGTQLGSSFENEKFWHKVIHFFVNNPMLDPDQVGPLVDYMHNQKFVPREETIDGQVVQLAPEQPNFSIKGRSMDKLLRQMEMWHRHLTRAERLPSRVWAPSGIGEMDWTDTDLYGNDKERWIVTELLTSKELQFEGGHMHHCVGSYWNNCKKGNISVWSMQVTGQDQQTHRVMTIAVQNRSQSIKQARGKCNALPSGRTPSGKRRGFNKEYERHLRKSKHVLFMWREQEGLSMSRNA